MPIPNNLIFSDDFEGINLDSTSKWNVSYFWDNQGSTNPGNNELEWYLPANVSVENGYLKLTAKKELVNASDGKTYPYTSGIVTTDKKFSFLYGHMEMKAKIPAGKGIWPAFWTLPMDHSWPPEIDAMEILGDNPFKVYMTVHFYRNSTAKGSGGGVYTGPDYSKDFHIFGVNWQPDSVTWYIDGIQRAQYGNKKFIPNKSMYLLANLAVGGDWPGSPDANTVFPASMHIDYIKVFK